ncbi:MULTISPECIES: amino acid deaminase/aldolase [unclassified Rhodococcus (in: high G+C Gram-positive bacteria)]|uniref:amino acid deaminase/aldolase n=1 Tax=unclassified Rhodococcus (in: high G+C Gram-positive bacteria) TaxID=192944 RepID=UPI00163A6779|nr:MULTISPECIES: amino acid deaminase/aldolase [unclassified Rhodococcus (in: high G+C Gram-positive bacteria)]MBC2643253.1 amino acid deaminase/aldolase [Rhodococcus sp. 3A]MBC2892006.1 amino acid deaminase/aldolase [Rhodococcus sp. 4CII]
MTPTLDRLIAATAEVDPPLAALDLPTLRANAADLVERAGGTPVRVASKSVRCRAVLQVALGENLTASGGFRGIMAYSLREAIWLARHGATDILMGYPTADRGALSELAADPDLLNRITLMVDSDDQLDFLLAAAGVTSLRARLCVDVDASLRLGPLHIGVRRSPLREPAAVAAFVRRAAARGFAVVGVMFYEAQIAGLPDSSPPVGWMKRASAKELATRRSAVVNAVQTEVGVLEIVNSGGTGSLEVSSADPVVTEVTAGSGLYVPTLFDRYRAFSPHPALYFALSTVRKPAPGIATLFGGGYIASGPAGRRRVPTPTWPPRLKLLRNEGAGEVQTPVTGTVATELGIGDRVWFRHAKAGELCERFTDIHLVESDGSRTVVPTYRGEGRCFG